MRIPFLLSLIALSLRAQSVLVLPYVQPGPDTGPETDSAALRWLTDATGGEFTVRYEVNGGTTATAAVERVEIRLAASKPKAGKKEITRADRIAEAGQHYQRFEAVLPALPLDATVAYEVHAPTGLVRSASFRTRASPGQPVRVALVGDMAKDSPGQNAVAHRISLEKPDFMIALGDIVYPEGRVSEYMSHFWKTYNQPPLSSPETGAPLMASLPLRALLGNHDADVNNLVTMPDALGAYYFFRAPANGPGLGSWATPLRKGPEYDAFRGAVGTSHPALSVHSYDAGPLHVAVIDNNGYANVADPTLLAWLERDLTSTRQPWKIVCLHAPIFQSSLDHYTEQKCRLLVPLLEKCGVDLVLSGHVHNFQRTVPLRFIPATGKREANGCVNGSFQLDATFDGKDRTRPEGIVYVVSGGGGGHLNRVDPVRNGEAIAAKYPGNWVPYTASFHDHGHSFVILDAAPDRLQLRAVSDQGAEIDRVVLTP